MSDTPLNAIVRELFSPAPFHHVPDEIYWELENFIARQVQDAPHCNRHTPIQSMNLDWDKDGYEAKVKVEYSSDREIGASLYGDSESWVNNDIEEFSVSEFKYNGLRTDFDARKLYPSL